MVRNFNEIDKEDVAIAGGKGANLGEMTRAGLAVPQGFVVTSDAYHLFLKENGLDVWMKETLETIREKSSTEQEKLLLEAVQQFRERIVEGTIPEEVREKVLVEYKKLGAGQVRVAVRSSATAEDLPDASFAGQQETYLNVVGEQEVLKQIKNCYASLWGNRAVLYREKQGYAQTEVALAVVIQEMVESETAGVLFTANPVTNNRNEMQINASYGLGESVVSGRVTADTYLCDKNGKLLSTQLGDKKTEIIYADHFSESRKDNARDNNIGEIKAENEDKNSNEIGVGDGGKNGGTIKAGYDSKIGSGDEGRISGTIEVEVEEARRNRQALSVEEIQALCQEALKVEEYYGCPMDIEWAIWAGRVYILQARAITTLTEAYDETKLMEYVKRNKISGALRDNMAFLLEKLSAPFYPLDEAFVGAINNQKSEIFEEIGVIISMQPEIDDEGITYLPKSGKKFDKRIGNIPSMIREIRDYDHCKTIMDERMEKFYRYLNQLERMIIRNLRIEQVGEAISKSYDFVQKVAYARFKYALFPSFFGDKVLGKAVKKVDKNLTTFDLYGGLDYKTAVVTRDINALAETIRADEELKKAIQEGMSYSEAAEQFPVIRQSVEAFLKKHGYKSDFNCYCIYAESFLENPDRLLHIVKPLLQNEAMVENEKYTAIKKEWKKTLSPKQYDKLIKEAEIFRHFHVIREESQYMWEEAFYYIKQMVKRASLLLAGSEDYKDTIAYLFYDELIEACKRGSLTNEDLEKIKRRKENRPFAFKVWERCKLEVFKDQGDTLKGISGSRGEAVGKVCVIHGPEEFCKMQKGDILVCPYTDPEWTPLFQLASAVVADTGAALSHAAIVAREYGIPAVLGVGLATAKYQDGDMIRVNGDAGEVRKING